MEKTKKTYLYKALAVFEGVIPPPQLQEGDTMQQHTIIHPAGHHPSKPLHTQNVPTQVQENTQYRWKSEKN